MNRLSHRLLFIAASLLLWGCTRPASATETASAPTTVTVFAAASLTEAFTEIGQTFSAAHPDLAVTFNFAGSQQLAQQISQGAPVDLFASANNTQMKVAIESGRILTGTARIFTHNRLVIVTSVDNPAGVTTLQDLTNPGIKIIFAAQEVPVGQYALDFLDKANADGSLGAGYRDRVMANVVSYEANVRAVLAKVTLGEADAGIVYSSDITQAAGAQVQRIAIPDPLNTLAGYPIAPLRDSPNPAAAQRFVEYVLSAEGQQILESYGFIALKENE